MAEKKKAGVLRALGSDGQIITAKVGSIEIGNLTTALEDPTDKSRMQRPSAAAGRMNPTGDRSADFVSFKNFTCTGRWLLGRQHEP